MQLDQKSDANEQNNERNQKMNVGDDCLEDFQKTQVIPQMALPSGNSELLAVC